MRAGSVLLVLLIVLSSAAGAGEETKRADGELRRLVDDALDRGAAWLADRQDWNGAFRGTYSAGYPLGGSALPLLALLHSGVPKDAPHVRRGITWLRSAWRSRAPRHHHTYGVACAILALVESGRGPRGTLELPEADGAWLQEMTDFLVDAQLDRGGWTYGRAARGSRACDHSNAQYALLALREARRAGAEVPEETFLRALRHFLSVQQDDGPRVRRYREHGGDGVYFASREKTDAFDRARGWTYAGGRGAPTGSMTAAGVAAVRICLDAMDRERHGELRESAIRSARDGLAWLGRHFSVTGNPGSPSSWHFYWLYGLERAGVLSRVVYMGGHRWYAEGARWLVDAQGPDGAWPTLWPGRVGIGPPNTVDQSFALLFLSRSTARSFGIATEKPLADLTRGDGLEGDAFGALFAAAFEEMEGLAAERAKKRAREFALLGPRILPLLLKRLHAGEEPVRERAAAILRAVTGERFGFEPGGDPGEREAAADRWTEWYLARRAGLELDRENLLLR